MSRVPTERVSRLWWNPDSPPLWVVEDTDGKLLGIGPEGRAEPFTGDATALQEIRRPTAPAFPTEFFAELVGVAEIASRAGVPAGTIQQWRRRHDDFPAPLVTLAAGPVWLWEAVDRWLRIRPPSGRPAHGVVVSVPVAYSGVFKPIHSNGQRTYRLRDRFERGSVTVTVRGAAVKVIENEDAHTLFFPEPPAAGETIQLTYRSRLE
jgi:hypothetical protein